MSTHDYVIDNQSAVAFRADLNAVLAALVTQNSNAVAPTTTFANMIWYDTATNILKKRNEANSGWISLGTIDETAGTFTPSGERALASQAQAEAGTDNATLMTPLRTAQVIAAQVGSGNAGLSAGAVGTYIFAHSSADVAFGETVAGSTLYPTSAARRVSFNSTGIAQFNSGSALSGTWRCMGTFDLIASGTGYSISGATLWLRIS